MTEWFYCWNCEIELGDPYAERQGNRIIGKCERCGATLDKPAPEKTEPQRPEQPLTDFTPVAEPCDGGDG